MLDMEKLKRFVEIINQLKEYGVKVTEEQKEKEKELAVEEIKSAILPILEVINKDVLFRVCYCDNKIDIAFDDFAQDDDKCGDVRCVTEEGKNGIEPYGVDITDVVEYEQDEYELKRKGHRVTLKIRYIDVCGKRISEKKPTDMFEEFVNIVGPQKVYGLKIPYEDSFLVDVERTQKYFGQWRKLNNGYYLNVHSCTERKINQMKKIAEKVGIKINVVTYNIGEV